MRDTLCRTLLLCCCLLLAPLPAAGQPLGTEQPVATPAWTQALSCGESRVYWRGPQGWGLLLPRSGESTTVDARAEVLHLACLEATKGRLVVTQAVPGNAYLFHYGAGAADLVGLALGAFLEVYPLPPSAGRQRVLLLRSDALGHDTGPTLPIPITAGALDDLEVIHAELTAEEDEVDLAGGWVLEGRVVFAIEERLLALDPARPAAGLQPLARPAGLGELLSLQPLTSGEVLAAAWADGARLLRCGFGEPGLGACRVLHAWPSGGWWRPEAMAGTPWIYLVGPGCGDGAAEAPPATLLRIDAASGACAAVGEAEAILARLPPLGGMDRLLVNRAGTTWLLTLPQR